MNTDTSMVSDKKSNKGMRRRRGRKSGVGDSNSSDSAEPRTFSGICVRFPFLVSEHLKIVAQARGLSQNSLVIDYVKGHMPTTRVEQTPIKKVTGSIGVCLRFPIEIAESIRDRSDELDMSQNALIMTCVNAGLEAAKQDETVKAAIRTRLAELQVLSE